MVILENELKDRFPELENIGVCSIDLRLGNSFACLNNKYHHLYGTTRGIDVHNPPNDLYNTFITERSVTLESGEFLLACTDEIIDVPRDMAAFVAGRSSIGRFGLQVQNAGFIDAGFRGQITLELFNQSRCDLVIRPGDKICQIVFFQCNAEHPTGYNGRYVWQMGATQSKGI
jgi:dCTP deaminase